MLTYIPSSDRSTIDSGRTKNRGVSYVHYAEIGLLPEGGSQADYDQRFAMIVPLLEGTVRSWTEPTVVSYTLSDDTLVRAGTFLLPLCDGDIAFRRRDESSCRRKSKRFTFAVHEIRDREDGTDHRRETLIGSARKTPQQSSTPLPDGPDDPKSTKIVSTTGLGYERYRIWWCRSNLANAWYPRQTIWKCKRQLMPDGLVFGDEFHTKPLREAEPTWHDPQKYVRHVVRLVAEELAEPESDRSLSLWVCPWLSTILPVAHEGVWTATGLQFTLESKTGWFRVFWTAETLPAVREANQRYRNESGYGFVPRMLCDAHAQRMLAILESPPSDADFLLRFADRELPVCGRLLAPHSGYWRTRLSNLANPAGCSLEANVARLDPEQFSEPAVTAVLRYAYAGVLPSSAEFCGRAVDKESVQALLLQTLDLADLWLMDDLRRALCEDVLALQICPNTVEHLKLRAEAYSSHRLRDLIARYESRNLGSIGRSDSTHGRGLKRAIDLLDESASSHKRLRRTEREAPLVFLRTAGDSKSPRALSATSPFARPSGFRKTT